MQFTCESQAGARQGPREINQFPSLNTHAVPFAGIPNLAEMQCPGVVSWRYNAR